MRTYLTNQKRAERERRQREAVLLAREGKTVKRGPRRKRSATKQSAAHSPR